MAYLLRFLILIMFLGLFLTLALAKGWVHLEYSHIQIAIPAFLYTIFAQAFVMFYFIGIARLIDNIAFILASETRLEELFDEAPKDITPYKDKVRKYVYDMKVCKRQTIPWTMLMLLLGTIAFLLGGATDVSLVQTTTHSGVVYGFTAAMIIGVVRQWYYLGKCHKLLRQVKALFSLPDGQM